MLITSETAQVYHSSRATTCQALLLLGHREFGIGTYDRSNLYEPRFESYYICRFYGARLALYWCVHMFDIHFPFHDFRIAGMAIRMVSLDS